MTEADGALHESLPVGPAGRVQLPWPMAAAEAARWVVLLVSALVLSTAAVVWVVTAVTEPSLWRLVLPLGWLLLFKFVVFPRLVEVLRLADVDARWDRFAAASLDLR